MNSFVLLNSRNLLTNQAEKCLWQNENYTKMKGIQRKKAINISQNLVFLSFFHRKLPFGHFRSFLAPLFICSHLAQNISHLFCLRTLRKATPHQYFRRSGIFVVFPFKVDFWPFSIIFGPIVHLLTSCTKYLSPLLSQKSGSPSILKTSPTDPPR